MCYPCVRKHKERLNQREKNTYLNKKNSGNCLNFTVQILSPLSSWKRKCRMYIIK